MTELVLMDKAAAGVAVVLTGADPAFCAGLDLSELCDGGRALSGTHAAEPPHESPVPVIAAVNGRRCPRLPVAALTVPSAVPNTAIQLY